MDDENNETEEISYPFENVRERVFKGSVPIKFILSEDEKSKIPETIDYELAYFTNIPRCSYLPIYTYEIANYFIQRNIVDNSDNIWYSCNDVPLKWHYAVGLLYDIFNNSNSNQSKDSENPENSFLPWEVTVHFSDFPKNKLLKFKSIDTLKDTYFTTLKESDYMRYGNANKVMCLSLDDQSLLWDSLCNLSFKDFWSINSKLLVNTPWSNISARIYFNNTVIQERFAEVNEENITLKDLITSWCPEVLNDNNNNEDYSIILHGLNIPLDTPLLWLGQYLSYPDNWLHIVIKQKNKD